ncbi:MAG: hypothetical protein DI551_05730 [Micavibrio aeruginosavorus]|uniref:Thioredoxin domain-containing protein n=1 Tax=Micavibrio aeruginosavorus TaxID=349221 RepID=A0A2W5N0F7_9BACT|nr:MAG: hypothetical protein DI551_05730 [Micavibrio aeruginosavorus]
MKNKIIFASVVALVFTLAALTGFYGPAKLKAYQGEKLQESFTPGSVPKLVLDRFSRQFAKVLVASEAQYMPEEPFLDPKSNTVRMRDFQGRPTLVNLWATWCAPCVVELPSLEKFEKHYRGRINVLAVAVEEGKDPGDIAKFLESRLLGDFAGYVDKGGRFASNLGIRGIPTSFVIGSDGLILYRLEGDADWTSPEVQAFFDILLLQNR